MIHERIIRLNFLTAQRKILFEENEGRGGAVKQPWPVSTGKIRNIFELFGRSLA
jgi:hypothetical protein